MYDPKHFMIICGQEVLNDYRDKVSLAVNGLGYDLVTTQERLWNENGFRDAQLVPSTQGWTVRSGSGLDGWRFIAGRNQNWTLNQATEAAKTWQTEDPTKRFVWAYKKDIPQHESCTHAVIELHDGYVAYQYGNNVSGREPCPDRNESGELAKALNNAVKACIICGAKTFEFLEG